MSLHDQAMAFAKKGYFVFPLLPNTKVPLTKNGHLDATSDSNRINSYWTKTPDANIGISLEPSNLLLLDIDRHQGKADGVANFQALQGENKIPSTPRAKTGGNGYHFFFKRPKDGVIGKLTGIGEVKIKGYAVVPPSVHPDTKKTYEWEEGCSLLDCEPAEIPEWLLGHLVNSKKRSAKIDRFSTQENLGISGEMIISQCPFMTHWATDAAELSEPEWYYGIGVLAHADNGNVLIHQYSRLYPDYDYEETENKINHWKGKEAERGPATCQSIQDKCGDAFCKSCPYKGHIPSPIVLGYARNSSEHLKQVTPFPIDALPPVFRDFTLNAAMAIQCPVDYVACSLLATVSILMGGKRRIQLDHEWVQQGNLWIAIVGTPSAKKSPAMEKTGMYIRQIEEQLHSKYQNELNFYESDLRKYEVDLKQWQKEQSGNPPLKPQKPVLKRLSTSDSTVEALGELLAANPHGLALICDELSSWMRSMNQYKGGRGADRSHYLSMWSNAQITIDRKNKEPIHVNSPYLTILGGIQPDVLLELSDNGVEDGMKERFLFSCPMPITEPPRIGIKIPQEVQNAIKEALEQIYQTRPVQDLTITLSVEAQDEFLKARQEWHQKQQSDGFSSEMEAYYVKMVSYLGRLALVLHEMQRPINSQDCNVIDKTTMQHAKALTDYFLNHAAIALGMVKQSHEEQQVEKALHWIKSKRLSVVSPREMVTSKVAGVKKATEARHLLRVIHDYGYGYWNESTDRLILSQDSVSNAAG